MKKWQKQLQNSITTLDQLKKSIRLSVEEEEAIKTVRSKWSITPHILSLMDKDDPACPIRRQFVPSLAEKKNVYGQEDFLYKHENWDKEPDRPHSVARQYHDRVAFLVSQVCATYCRHCLRKEAIMEENKFGLRFDIEEGFQWIREHKEIRDILFTGGDPFLLPDEKIEYLIARAREIPHVQMIRFGSRTLVTLPDRITARLCKILKGYHKVPIWINTQVNHPREITEKTARAAYKLTCCGINIGNQTVLLRGINDDVAVFKELNQKLLAIRIRPYYLYACNMAPRIDHFRVPLETGLKLIHEGIRGHTSGLAQPHYVITTNLGKIMLNDEYYIVNKSPTKWTLRNHNGEIIAIPNPPA
ncbi:MAG: KamA family radical SAM protein [Deltaproteobacteria bacterium]|jgi:lysine 2,3-aminomutase|nr:KamA family radical SAM protein [Deltaproteobacteria bacterium]